MTSSRAWIVRNQRKADPLAISRDDWDYTADVMAQAFFTCGVRRRCRAASDGFSLFMGGWGSLLGIGTGATAFPVGAGETERRSS
jgi:hypothetical protein